MPNITTAITHDSELIEINEISGFENEEGEFIRRFTTTRGNGGSFCDLQVYPKGNVYSSISAHSNEIAARLCTALGRRLGIIKKA